MIARAREVSSGGMYGGGGGGGAISRQLRLPTVAQPFDDAGVALDDRGRLARPERRGTVIDAV